MRTRTTAEEIAAAQRGELLTTALAAGDRAAGLATGDRSAAAPSALPPAAASTPAWSVPPNGASTPAWAQPRDRSGSPFRAPLPEPPEPPAAAAAGLDGGQRLQVVDTLLQVLGGAYAHLPQKRSGYALDPVQALQLFRRRCVEVSAEEFHLAMTGLVGGLRDAHTRYIGPTVLHGTVAALPFLVEQYGRHEDPTFVVSKVGPGLVDDPSFVEGVTLRWWNGVPFTRAVDLHAERETGGRPDARRSRGLESLTFRPLDYAPAPDEHWVDLGYRALNGAMHEVRIPWRVLRPGKAGSASRPGSRGALAMATDPAAEAVRRTKKLLFAPELWHADRLQVAAARSDEIPTTLPDVLATRVVPTRRGPVGHLRIWSFDVADDDEFLAEVIRLVAELPDQGLIIDLRSNPGGLIWAAERLLQLFSADPIIPTRFSLVASPLTRAMAECPFNRLELGPWADSLEDAISTGELYSQPLPLTDPDWCNDVGQHYRGPVVAVVDPNTYSSGDLFAAGFVDNGLGPLVSVGTASGGGGANVWTEAQLRDALGGTPFAVPALPGGVSFSLAIRRAIRSGRSDGVPIEDLGIPGIPYAMTGRDLLDDNHDLREFCAGLLAEPQ